MKIWDIIEKTGMAIFGIIIVCALGAFIITIGYIMIGTAHDIFFTEYEYKYETKFLEDVRYLDDGDVLLVFEDKVVRYLMIKDELEYGIYYDLTYKKILNAWIFDEEWGLEELKHSQMHNKEKVE